MTVFENGRAITCPDCGGDLQYQNRQSIVCLGCEQDYEHWQNASSHHLVEVDAHTAESEIVESTPRKIRTDGGCEAYIADTEHSRELMADRRTESCIDSYPVDLSTCNALGWVNVWLIANPRTIGNTTPDRNKLVGGVVDSPVSLTQATENRSPFSDANHTRDDR